jgi:hypothetical protein
MRISLILCVLIAVFSNVGAAQGDAKPPQEFDQYLGTWAGTWAGSEGGGGGELELVIEKGKDGQPTGRIKAAGGESGHSAIIKTLSFQGNQMTARYEYPLGEGGEIVMEAAFEATTGKGTWRLQPPGGSSEPVARGTWTVTKQ